MPGLTGKELQELFLKNKKGDKEARDKLFTVNLPLVHFLARRYSPEMFDYEDVFQEGCIGLLKALDNFDPSKGIKFSTYAVPYIIGEIRSFLRRNGSLFKVSRSYYQHYRQLLDYRRFLQQKLKREPRLDELAKEMGISREEITWLMEINSPLAALKAEKSGHLTAGRDEKMFTDRIFDKLQLKEILSGLPPLHRKIIVLRFFGEKSQEEIARKVGLSQSYVSRLEKRILKNIKLNGS